MDPNFQQTTPFSTHMVVAANMTEICGQTNLEKKTPP